MPARIPRPLPASRLRRRVAPSSLPFASTASVEPLAETIGQPRAADALALGLDLDAAGYNLFITGLPGSGREPMVRATLERLAPTRPRADDWVYVRDFADADRTTALRLPAGRGSELAQHVDEFIAAATRQIRAGFDSDQYAERGRAIASETAARRDELVEEIRRFARERGFGAEMTMTGIVTVPLIRGEPIDPDQFRRMSDRTRQALEERGREIQAKIGETLANLRALEKETAQRMRSLDREVAEFAAGPPAAELEAAFADLPEVAAHVRALLEEMLAHLDDFRGDEHPEAAPQIAALLGPRPNGRTDRYRVNVLVDNASAPGAPVVFERSPTYYNLGGRIDYRSAFGTMVTDFRQVKPGALHRANGGFLVLHAEEVLRAPFAWDALKGALTSREIRIENLASQYSAVPTVTLRPQPIPLDVKVVIIGTPQLYHLLSAVDDDFRELFKVRVDFAPDMDWTEETSAGYARLISRLVRDSGLRHFNRAAVARVIEHGARLEDDQRKLTARLGEISDLVTEASYWAGKARRRLVTAADVGRAIEQREFRSNMLEARLREVVARGILRVDTSGERVGQVNGVAVIGVGGHAFGQPCRISASTALGEGGVRSIERESDLSGKLHSKGVLILAGYLASTYAQDQPLALAARIAFEQSYDEVDGDSASCAELCVLLSALADTGIRQGIAITGSIDQHGDVQAVGGVTTKIEGFFDVCAANGLTGDQGMIIPATNVETLMLKEAVVAAVRAGRFHIWPVRTVDQAMAVLTGRTPGRRRRDGTFPPGSIHEAAERRLHQYADAARRFGMAAAQTRTAGEPDGRQGRRRARR
jgi:lon-related putative ATP-dependent protease